MPFVTEFNTSLILKELIENIPFDIHLWDPYKKPIYFLNNFDKADLYRFKEFCKNPFESIETVYKPINLTDTKKYIYEGSKPSYHKIEDCERLSSNFINFKIPDIIKKKGDYSIDEFRKWFKENQILFAKKPDIYQMRLQTKYGIFESIEKVNYKNSGSVYKENLTLKQIETRLDSLLYNASEYYKADLGRQVVLKAFQKLTFLAFKVEPIEKNYTGYSDEQVKKILIEYYHLFIQPTIFYLQEHFKAFYNTDIEINEKIFEYLNFKKCGACYSKDLKEKTSTLSDKNKNLIKIFGEYEFPIEPTHFYFKDSDKIEVRICFIYCHIFRCIDKNFQADDVGYFKKFKAEFIDHRNKFIYTETKIYKSDIDNIKLFRKYITKIEQNKITRECNYTTYAYEK